MRKLKGPILAEGFKVGIVVSQWNSAITETLLEGATGAFQKARGDLENLTVVYVPGCFEIPLAIKRLAFSKKLDALVALGSVIRGETSHYDFVAGECISGIQRIALDFDIPVGLGVLTTENREQALRRSDLNGGNKGAEALDAALEMANLLKELPVT